MKIAPTSDEVLKIAFCNGYHAAGRAVDANWHVLARARTADGLEGVGYIVQTRGDLMRTIASGPVELAEHLYGMDIREPEAVWRSVARWLPPRSTGLRE